MSGCQRESWRKQLPGAVIALGCVLGWTLPVQGQSPGGYGYPPPPLEPYQGEMLRHGMILYHQDQIRAHRQELQRLGAGGSGNPVVPPAAPLAVAAGRVDRKAGGANVRASYSMDRPSMLDVAPLSFPMIRGTRF